MKRFYDNLRSPKLSTGAHNYSTKIWWATLNEGDFCYIEKEHLVDALPLESVIAHTFITDTCRIGYLRNYWFILNNNFPSR